MSSTPTVAAEGKTLSNGSAFPRELLFKFLVIGDYGVGKKVSVPLVAFVIWWITTATSHTFMISFAQDVLSVCHSFKRNSLRSGLNLQTLVNTGLTSRPNSMAFHISKILTKEQSMNWLAVTREIFRFVLCFGFAREHTQNVLGLFTLFTFDICVLLTWTSGPQRLMHVRILKNARIKNFFCFIWLRCQFPRLCCDKWKDEWLI